MAFITVRNAKVTYPNAKGFTLVEEFTTRDGETRTKKFKVWTEEPVTEGEMLNVSGIFGAKVAEYDGTTYVEVSINKPRIERGVLEILGTASKINDYNKTQKDSAPF